MPDRLYDYEQPAAPDLPWDSEAAARIVPIAGRSRHRFDLNSAECETGKTRRRIILSPGIAREMELKLQSVHYRARGNRAKMECAIRFSLHLHGCENIV